MSLKTLSVLCSLLLISLSSSVMFGWIFHIPTLVQLAPGLVGMVFNTASCFCLFGIYLLLSNLYPNKCNNLKKIILLYIACIALFSFVQDIIKVDFGIDRMFIYPWLKDPNPTPGRMAPNTSLAFLISTTVGFLLSCRHKKYVGITIQFLTFLILIIALLGLLVYSLKLEFIFSWYSYTRMAVHTATCFIILSLAWFTYWSQSDWYKTFYKGREDKRIIFITGTILLCITLTAGLGAVALLTHQNILAIHRIFKSSLQNKINLVYSSINNIENNIALTVNSPLLSLALKDHKISEHQHELAEVTEFIFSRGLSALTILDDKEKILIQKGSFLTGVKAKLKLNEPYQACLAWNNGVYLQFHVPIINDHKIIGYLQGEAPMKIVDDVMKDYKDLGNSGETAICGLIDTTTAQCLPMRLQPTPFVVKLIIDQVPLPMYYALNNQSGTINTLDYRRKNVIAAYGPISNLKIGMVTKIDSEEIYKPINRNLKTIFPLALLLILAGLLLLYWQVVPLVKQVIESESNAQKTKSALEESEKALHSINQRLEANVDLLNQKNSELSLLTAFLYALQACYTIAESTKIISHYLIKFFPGSSGVLYLIDEQTNYFKLINHWGITINKADNLKIEDCIALQNQEIYYPKPSSSYLCCNHIDDELSKNQYICIPLNIRGKNSGLVSLSFPHASHDALFVDDNRNTLAITLKAHLGLALSNIKLSEQLKYLSIKDPLTGLFNRRYLDEIFNKEIERAARKSETLAILMIDIDHFKNVNDLYGHNIGDKLIKSLAELLLRMIRPHDVACRFGGEEFFVLLTNIDIAFAKLRAEEIRNAVLEMTSINQLGISPTISIGISIYPLHAKDSEELIIKADQALYQAKNSGRNKVILYQ